MQDHLEEYVTIEEVLRSWYTYYGQVFQQTLQTHEHIQKLEKQQGLDDTMRIKIKDHIILETTKLEKLEKEAHLWKKQALPSISTLDKICPQMKKLSRWDLTWKTSQTIPFKRRCQLYQASQP